MAVWDNHQLVNRVQEDRKSQPDAVEFWYNTVKRHDNLMGYSSSRYTRHERF